MDGRTRREPSFTHLKNLFTMLTPGCQGSRRGRSAEASERGCRSGSSSSSRRTENSRTSSARPRSSHGSSKIGRGSTGRSKRKRISEGVSSRERYSAKQHRTRFETCYGVAKTIWGLGITVCQCQEQRLWSQCSQSDIARAVVPGYLCLSVSGECTCICVADRW